MTDHSLGCPSQDDGSSKYLEIKFARRHSEVKFTLRFHVVRLKVENVKSATCVRVGTAGWSIPNEIRSQFAQGDSLLQRYATRFNAVEINSSFYRSHRAKTYEKWASEVPPEFLFAVKLPRSITHHAKLLDIDELLKQFAGEVEGLDSKLGCVLVQLPPSLEFNQLHAKFAFESLRKAFRCAIACEPRNQTWISSEVDKLFATTTVARVAADPARHENFSVPGGDTSTRYYRLHGSPRIYYSEYNSQVLESYAGAILEQGCANWCIFDNTASGHAILNALKMQHLLARNG